MRKLASKHMSHVKTDHQASARFLLDRIPLIDRQRSHLVANPDDADDERSDERDDAEQAAGDATVNVMVEALANPDLGPQEAAPTPGGNQGVAGPRSWEHQAPSGPLGARCRTWPTTLLSSLPG